jgi:hypothetical protein
MKYIGIKHEFPKEVKEEKVQGRENTKAGGLQQQKEGVV